MASRGRESPDALNGIYRQGAENVSENWTGRARGQFSAGRPDSSIGRRSAAGYDKSPANGGFVQEQQRAKSRQGEVECADCSMATVVVTMLIEVRSTSSSGRG